MKIQQAFLRNLSFLLVFCILFSVMPVFDLSSITGIHKAAAETVNLSDTVTDKSGWIYRKCSDGTVEIIGFSDPSAIKLRIPEMLDDMWVTRIGNQAFAMNAALERIVIHGAIISIYDSAFPAHTALTVAGWNGSAGMEYAAERGFAFDNQSSYDFYDDLIDLSELDASQWSVEDGYLWVAEPYAARITVGTALFIPPNSSYPKGLPVTVLSTKPGNNHMLFTFEELAFDLAIESYEEKNALLVADMSKAVVLSEGVEILYQDAPATYGNAQVTQQPISISVNFKINDNSSVMGAITIDPQMVVDVEYSNMTFQSFSYINKLNITGDVRVVGSFDAIKPKQLEKKLLKFPLYSNGLLSVWAQASAFVTLSGEVSLAFSLENTQRVSWADGNQNSDSLNTINYCHVDTAAGVELGAKLGLALKLGFPSVGMTEQLADKTAFEIATVSGSAGVSCKASSSTTNGIPSALSCSDVSIEPFVRFNLGLPPVKTEITFDPGLFNKVTLHWEQDLEHPLGHFVDKCTYKETPEFLVQFATGTTQQIDSQLVEEGSFAICPQVAERKGYVLDGWYTDPAYTSEWLFDVHKVYGNTMLYAKWSEDPDAVPEAGSTPKPILPPSQLPEIDDSDNTYVPSFPELGYPEEELVVYGNLVLYFNQYYEHWEIVGHVGDPVSLVIPANIDGYPVAFLWGGSLAYCDSLTYVEIEKRTSSFSLVDDAFYGCSNLTEIVLPDDSYYISISDAAFAGCPNLESLTVPAETYNLKNILDHIPSLKTLTYREPSSGSLEIEAETFMGMTNLEYVYVTPDSYASAYEDAGEVRSIGDRAFAGCTNLKQVHAYVRGSIGESAFEGCTSLIDICTNHIGFNTAESIGDRAFKDCTALTTAEMDGTIYIGNQAFYGCTNLTFVRIMGWDLEMGTEVFRGCSNINHFSAADGCLTELPAWTFADCQNTSGIILDVPGLEKIGDGAFYNCSNMWMIRWPDSITSIGNEAFRNCTNLNPDDVDSMYGPGYPVWPASLTSIGDRAFMDCTRIRSLSSLPAGLTHIGDQAFEGCISVSAVTLPDSIKSIGRRAFAGFFPWNTFSLVLPDSLEYIGENAFEGWYLDELTVYPRTTYECLNAFRDMHSIHTVYTYSGSAALAFFPENIPHVQIVMLDEAEPYAILYNTIHFGTLVKPGYPGSPVPMIQPPVHDDLTFIGWYKDEVLTQPWVQGADVMPESDLELFAKWSTIELGGNTDGLFVDEGFIITSLEIGSLTGKIPNTIGGKTVTGIGSGAIYGAVTQLHIPAGVNNIAPGAFINAENLKAITVDSGNTGYYAVDGVLYSSDGVLVYYPVCKDDVAFDIPEGITNIDSHAFSSCNALTELTFPSSLSTISSSAIEMCDSLDTIVFSADLSVADAECAAMLSDADIRGPVNAMNLISMADDYKIHYNEYQLRFTDAGILKAIVIARAGEPVIEPGYSFTHSMMTFRGWSAQEDGSELWDFEEDLMPADDLTLHAVWTYDFEYEESGNGLRLTRYTGMRTTIDVPHYIGDKYVTEISEGIFDGLGDITLIGEKGGIVESFASNAGIRFEPRKHTVTFVSNGGTYVAPIQCCATETFSAPSISKDNAYLNGWINAATDEYWNFWTNEMPACDLVLYARWYTYGEVNDAEFEFDTSEEGLTLTGYLGTKGDVVIPETINDVPVIAIGANAFRNDSHLRSVTIPGSVQVIGDGAFQGSRVTSVIIETGVTTIGSCTFAGCAELVSIEIADSVNIIGEEAFRDCVSLRGELKLPAALTVLEQDTFLHCQMLSRIILPASLERIESGAFNGCALMDDISIGASAEYIASDAFDGCGALSAITVTEDNAHYMSLDGVLMNKSGTEIIRYPEGREAEHYDIPEGVLAVCGGAFRNNGLKSVAIPASTTTISRAAFQSGILLEKVTFADDSQLTSIGENAFSGCSNITEFTVPESVSSLGARAFSGCMLTSIRIPADCVIGEAAIPARNGLVIYSENGSEAQQYAEGHGIRFQSSDSSNILVTGITLPENAEVSVGQKIQLTAALQPADTTETDIHWSINPIYAASIDQNGHITGIHPGVVTVTATAANGSKAHCTLTVVESNNQPERIVLNATEITMIVGGRYTLVAEVLPADANDKSVTWTVEDTSVAVCSDGAVTGLKPGGTVIIVETANGIRAACEVNVVQDDRLVADAVLPASLVVIEEEAFLGAAFEAVVIPDGVTTISGRAFADCQQLKQITIPESVTFIADDAFENCGDIVLYLTEGSAAEKCAKKNGYAYIIDFVCPEEPEVDVRP